MSFTQEQMHQVARLARIRVADKDAAYFHHSIVQVLDWVKMLDEISTQDVAPLTSVHLDEMPWRADIVTDGEKVQEILANAPQAKHGMFVVPKVVE